MKNKSIEKKQYLEQYYQIKMELNRLEAKIQEVRRCKVSPSINLDGMPHGSNKKDLSDYAVKLEELSTKYYQIRYQRIKVFEEITDKIEAHGTEVEKQVLFERYIKGEKWEDICENMGYSLQHIHRIHNKAIANFKM